MTDMMNRIGNFLVRCGIRNSDDLILRGLLSFFILVMAVIVISFVYILFTVDFVGTSIFFGILLGIVSIFLFLRACIKRVVKEEEDDSHNFY
jgi:hypothetical protein